MKYIAIILCLVSFRSSANWIDGSGVHPVNDFVCTQFNPNTRHFFTTYTWNTASTNILINNSTFGTPLLAGDVVNIQPRPGDYRSFYIQNLVSSAPATDKINIIWAPTARIAASSSSLQANGTENCKGVYIYAFKMFDHVDAAMRLVGTSYSSWITWDSCYFRGTPGFGPVQASSAPSFNGDSAVTWHHWNFEHCVWDSVYQGTGGGVALAIGGSAGGVFASNGWWRDCVVDGCLFMNYNSEHIGSQDYTSNFIRLLQAINVDLYGNRFVNLGVSLHPPGHAACVVSLGSKYSAHENFFGPFNFGNDFRDLGPIDMPMWGAAYSGRSSFYNNISVNKRKYGVFDTRTIAPGSLSELAPYVQSRAMAYVWNITAYNMGVGAGGNGPYETNIVDMGASDSLFLKNCVLVAVRDTTWGTIYGPFLWSQAGAPINSFDTAKNRLVQLWANAGISDSSTFKPVAGGLLNGQGVATPSFITKDYYGNPRTTSTGVDIGAVQLFYATCNCITTRTPIKLH